MEQSLKDKLLTFMFGLTHKILHQHPDELQSTQLTLGNLVEDL